MLRPAVLRVFAVALMAAAFARGSEEASVPAPAYATPATDPAARAALAAAPAARLELESSPAGEMSPYRRHAPLAFFSLGSLAVGGVFYGIHANMGYPGQGPVSGDGSRMGVAVGAAGLTAVAAGAAYLYYALRADGGSPSWIERLTGGVSADGAVSASIALPLPTAD